jgi:hypothetical protein
MPAWLLPLQVAVYFFPMLGYDAGGRYPRKASNVLPKFWFTDIVFLHRLQLAPTSLTVHRGCGGASTCKRTVLIAVKHLSPFEDAAGLLFSVWCSRDAHKIRVELGDELEMNRSRPAALVDDP